MFFATPVIRTVARMELPSTRAEITWVRFESLSRFIMEALYLVVSMLST